jgi:hypothetical protein
MLLLLFWFLVLHLVQLRFQAIESCAPDATVGLQPRVKLVEWLRAQLVDALLGNWMHLDEPGIAEHAEVLGHLRLTEPKPLGDFSHRTGPITQELDNVQSVRFGQSTQCRQHEVNIPQRAYTCQGI